jgi:hypothetical protein
LVVHSPDTRSQDGSSCQEVLSMTTAQHHLFSRPLPPCQFVLEDDDGFMHLCRKPARYLDCGSTILPKSELYTWRSTLTPTAKVGPACLDHACSRHHPEYSNHVVEFTDSQLDEFIKVLGAVRT